MKKEENTADLFNPVSRVAGYLWDRGWSEKNAGNISLMLQEGFDTGGYGQNVEMILKEETPHLKGRCIYITGAGKRMRDIAEYAGDKGVIIQINDTGSVCSCWSPGNHKVTPSSEWPSHLAIHNMIAQRGTGEEVVIHTHATEIIAMTQSKAIGSSEDLNSIIWGMQPETVVCLPKGVGFLKYRLRGTQEIARATVECFRDHDMVVWEKHGIFAIGETPEDTFDNIDIVCKSAKIWFLCRSAGFEPEGLTPEELEELRQVMDKSDHK